MDDTSGVLAMISALVSSVALVGVAASLVIQTRQLRTSQLQATRAAQAEMVQIWLGNPRLFLPGDDATAEPTDLYAFHAFTNLVLKYLELGFEIGVVSEPSVRMQAADLFQSRYRQHWWSEVARPVYNVEAKTRRERRFARIVDEEFGKAAKESKRADRTTDTAVKAREGTISSEHAAPTTGSA
jgi:hypothetical protein